EIIKIKKSSGHFTVQTPSSAVDVVSVVVTAGAFPKRLGIKGEKEFTGKGVSYCATCDANFFKGKIVAVLGGGNSAVEEAIYLSKFAAKIYLIHRRDRLRAVGVLQDRIFSLSNLEFMLENIVEEIGGESRVEYINVKDVKSGIKKNISLDGVFIFAGYSPNSNFVQNFLQLDSGGYIITDGDFKTSQEGVFAAGDVRSSSLKQVVSACGEGAKAAVSCIKCIEKIKGVAYE
ncbi:MAG: FAD-dependent oxidoreductase, partial [Candidatus Omnitrophica bacterium]|nr:FAD-dependent oxidoreductase [Candidatus Omnitrophota bacterium]